jgi:hypothetical protein
VARAAGHRGAERIVRSVQARARHTRVVRAADSIVTIEIARAERIRPGVPDAAVERRQITRHLASRLAVALGTAALLRRGAGVDVEALGVEPKPQDEGSPADVPADRADGGDGLLGLAVEEASLDPKEPRLLLVLRHERVRDRKAADRVERERQALHAKGRNLVSSLPAEDLELDLARDALNESVGLEDDHHLRARTRIGAAGRRDDERGGAESGRRVLHGPPHVSV